MRRIVVTRSMVLGLGLAGATAAIGQDLLPPATSEPAVGMPEAAELPKPFDLPPPADGPVLAVPGGLALPGGSGSTSSISTLSDTDDLLGDLPPLIGPAEAPGASSGPKPWSPGSTPSLSEPPRGPRTITLESIPTGDLAPLPDPAPKPDAAPRRSSPATPPPAPARRPRFLGLFPLGNPATILRPGANAGRGENRNTTVPPRASGVFKDDDKDGPLSDPAADAALKRRVEEQVRAYAGNRLRSFDVRVVDRVVTIHAYALRFWQRRAVKKTLETLPALAGYRANIEVLD